MINPMWANTATECKAETTAAPKHNANALGTTVSVSNVQTLKELKRVGY